MVRLREVPRTAAFAWSPGAAPPLIATGTKAGAVDIDFSNETCLELWDLALDGRGQANELRPSGKVATEAGWAFPTIQLLASCKIADSGWAASMIWPGPTLAQARRGG